MSLNIIYIAGQPPVIGWWSITTNALPDAMHVYNVSKLPKKLGIKIQ